MRASKRSITVSAALVATMVLAACGGDDEPDEEGGEAEFVGDVEDVVLGGLAEVGVDEEDFEAGLGDGDGEVGSDGAFALAGAGAGAGGHRKTCRRLDP